MSYTLEFLSIELEEVRKFFASGDAAVRDAIIEEGKEIYRSDDADMDEEVQEARIVWKEIVLSLSGGDFGKYLAEQPVLGITGDHNHQVSEMKSIVMASVIRRYGENIAGVFHSSGSGETFRSEPFEYLKQTGLFGRTDPLFLLERPLFNQIPDSFPGWGGLTRGELAEISMDDLTVAQADSGDSDVNIWVSEILNLTEEVKLRGLDLVTIYE
jgi:hypothetical protein